MDLTAISAAAVMFILGATSPGPSLAVVLRNTMIGGRGRGLACAVGHGIGFGFYAVSVVFGLVIIMENNPDVFTLMQIIGGLFLLYLGIEMMRAEAKEIEHSQGKREGLLRVSSSHSSTLKLRFSCSQFSLLFWTRRCLVIQNGSLQSWEQPSTQFGMCS